MKNIKGQVIAVMMIITASLYSCRQDTIVTSVDPDVQLKADLKVMEAYVNAKGYTDVDTTESGVWYVVLDSGSGAEINHNDIVSFFIAGRLTDGFLFATNIDTVDINNGTYDEDLTYNPIIYTYTADGWNIPEIITNFYSYERGYREGLSKVLGILKVGGRAQIIIPSGLAYSTNPPFGLGIPRNAVLVFDIYPSYVR